jgi:hypothetical protein
MAERGFDQNEEKKSYGSVFVLGIGLLVAFSLSKRDFIDLITQRRSRPTTRKIRSFRRMLIIRS